MPEEMSRHGTTLALSIVHLLCTSNRNKHCRQNRPVVHPSALNGRSTKTFTHDLKNSSSELSEQLKFLFFKLISNYEYSYVVVVQLVTVAGIWRFSHEISNSQ